MVIIDTELMDIINLTNIRIIKIKYSIYYNTP